MTAWWTTVATNTQARIHRVLARLSRLPLWVLAIGVYLIVRGVALLVLARFAALRETTLGSALSVWDGQWMLAIAEHGYAGVPYDLTDARGIHSAETAYAFFPGFPYLVGVISRLPLLTPFGAAMLVNGALGCVAAVAAAKLGSLCARRVAPHVNGRRVGLVLVVLFAASPMAVVLNMAYTEALFCALALWALVAVLERRWLLAGLMTCFAGATRPTAVVLIGVVMLAAMLALWQHLRGERRDTPAALWAALILSPLGYLGYLTLVWMRFDSPTAWFRIQTDGWGTTFDGGAGAWRFINNTLVNGSDVASVSTAWIMVVTLAVVAVAIWSRLPWPVLVFGTLLVASILLSSGLMISRPRLLLPAFVLLVPFAILLARSRRSVAVATLLPVVIGSAWFGAHMLTVFPHAI